jgi:probable rRNA maturation factor
VLQVPQVPQVPKVPQRLRVVVTDRYGRPLRAPGLAAWLAAVAPREARGEVAIAIVSDQYIRTLNRTYRRKDTPTDVLSFPTSTSSTSSTSTPSTPSTSSTSSTSTPSTTRTSSTSTLSTTRTSSTFGTSRPHLGDLVIAQGVARRQARAAGHSFAAELKVLALHGLLHLLGYDHDHPGDRGRMAKLERRLRVKGGLREGLVERASRRAGASGRRRSPGET